METRCDHHSRVGHAIDHPTHDMVVLLVYVENRINARIDIPTWIALRSIVDPCAKEVVMLDVCRAVQKETREVRSGLLNFSDKHIRQKEVEKSSFEPWP
jgi:hypothetical protein